MSRAHAILGPSSASKWLTCTPSARLEMQFPDSEGDAAKEGTLAHSLGELIIAQRSNAITNKEFRKQLDIIETNEFYNKAMYEYADDYAIYVLEQLGEAQKKTPDAKLFIEQKLDLSSQIPEGFGTGDAGIIADGILDIIDLKYGKGVKVSAEENSQLKIYALGWLAEFDHLFDIHTVRMTIYQPRMNNISVQEMTYVQLMVWAENVLRPKAEIAFKGEGDFVPGKHCQFCRAKTTCKANAEYQVQIAQMDFSCMMETTPELNNPQVLNADEISRILTLADSFKNWVKSVEDYALAQALEGKKWPGFKLVSGRSTRKFTTPLEVEKLLIKNGFDRNKIFKPQEMIGITEMEKLTGKKLFDTLISPLTVKAPGKPALVDVADKRPEYNNAATDFAGVDDELG